ncbi:acetate--CoA ligase family protein [Chloroflexota bacterium]
MKKFVEPRSVALVGATRRTGEDDFNILMNLLSYGYKGKIYPINPNATEILGLKIYPSIADVNDEVDLAIINLPRALVPGAVKECIRKGIHYIQIVAQGFADATDEEGKQLQGEIDKLLKENEVRIIGPNTLGIANGFAKFSSSFVKLQLEEVPIGIISQTGFYITAPELRLMGKVIDLGNTCDIDFADCLEYFEQDKETKVVALHIEGIRDSKRFLEVASRITRRKPVIALKTGRSEYAAKAAQSHTGSLVGRDEVWEAALRQCGIIRVDDIAELADLAKAFSLLPPMRGRGVGIMCYSGGLGIASIDACYRFGLELANFSPDTMRHITALLPSWQGVGNPADIWPAVMISKNPLDQVLTESIIPVLNDDEVHAALIAWAVQNSQHCNILCEIMVKLAEAHQAKPLVCCVDGYYAEEAKNRLKDVSGIMVAHSLDRAIRALAHMARYSAFREVF